MTREEREKIVCDLYFKFIEEFGRTPRISISGNGRTKKVEELTDTEINESRLGRAIRNTQSYKAYCKTRELSIDNIPEEFEKYKEFIEKHRKYDQEKEDKLKKIKDEKEECLYKDLVEWLRNHNGKMPNNYFYRDGECLHWVDQLTDKELSERNLYTRWLKSKLRNLMIRYEEVPLEDIPEEYREKIENIRNLKITKNKQKDMEDEER